MALSELTSTGIIFTMPNSDTGSRHLIELIKDFCEHHDFASSFISLGQIKYLSFLQYVDVLSATPQAAC